MVSIMGTAVAGDRARKRSEQGVAGVPHAKYQQIADRLREQITSGGTGPGERLPSEPDLVAEFDASRNTVRLAIALLTNQGLVVTRQGLGTFVQEPTRPFTALLSRVNVPPERAARVAGAAGASGPTPASRRRCGCWSRRSRRRASVAEKLDIEPGDAGGRPAVSQLHRRTCPGC